MTELQIGLIGLGVVAVVFVVVYNTWQEYRHRKLAQEVLSAQHEDVLLEPSEPVASMTGQGVFSEAGVDFVVEPELPVDPVAEVSVIDTPAIVPTGEPADRIEPVLRFDQEIRETPEPVIPPLNTLVETEPMPVVSRIEDTKENRDNTEPLHLLSPVIDYVASFEAVEPAPASQILESQCDVLARLRKPVHWIGYNERLREWEPIIDDGESEYRSIRVGLQLVDRNGPLADADLSGFHIAMQNLADELMAIANLPPRQPALDSAAKLDEFCASVDIQIGINVISQDQVFAGTKLRALAEAAGMVIDSEGRFVRCDDDGNVLYVLLNQEASGFSLDSMKTLTTHGVTFLLDVPRVAHGERIFNQMVDLARRFADVLRGRLVDDNRRPLSEGALEPIRLQVRQFQSLMNAQKLPAGGPLTRRLFS